MSWGPITPARIDFSDPAAPSAPDFGDIYHSRTGAWGQAQHVFIGGNHLPARWAGRSRFVILEAGFGLGQNFIATWAAWRADPRRPERLWHVAIEKHPPLQADLQRALAGSPEPALAAELVRRWPPLTPDLHLIDFDAGRVRLLLALGDIARVLPDLVATVDAFYLDGFAPARNPAMWDARALRALHRLAAADATLATWSVAAPVREALTSAGFEVARAPGFGAKREMTVARFAPRVAAKAPPGRQAFAARTVAVVGAGLAGAAAARAIAAQGLAVHVFERRAAPAGETSGQAGGLFHGVVHGNDGAHARWLRAGAIHLARDLAPRLVAGGVPGALCGLWRGERRMTLDAMEAAIARLALPADYVQTQRMPDGNAAWLYPAGGWANASALAAQWLCEPGITLRCQAPIAALRQRDGRAWQLLDAVGTVTAEADAVVLANACDLPRLWPQASWPLHALRAQSTLLRWAAAPELPRPIADAGYALRLADGRLLCGAASAPLADLALADAINSGAAPLCADDHARNLATLARLTGWRCDVDPAQLDGRAGARLHTRDRLPLIGPAPAPTTGLQFDQPRFVPRVPGLFVLGALGSRGLTQSLLGGEVLASWISGAPVPAPASLLDAIDAARFVTRAR